jgi:hypothetical protein
MATSVIGGTPEKDELDVEADSDNDGSGGTGAAVVAVVGAPCAAVVGDVVGCPGSTAPKPESVGADVLPSAMPSLLVGNDDGVFVGCKVGTRVGLRVGGRVGVRVGDRDVGMIVGLRDVGIDVGCLDVGTDVGARVGDLVGVRVGDRVVGDDGGVTMFWTAFAHPLVTLQRLHVAGHNNRAISPRVPEPEHKKQKPV